MKSLISLLCLSSLLLIACDEVQDTLDCDAICSKKQECVDEDYNVDECRDACEDAADESETYEKQLHECQDCVEDQSCLESVTCFDDCPLLP